MTAISAALAIALQHHQAGRLQLAEQHYRRILELEPAQPDAWHLLGVLAHQRGQFDAAIAYIGQAIRIQGDVGAFHNNLGEALRAAGQLPAAVACYERALALQPDFAEAHNNLGNAFQEQEQFAAAIGGYRRALAIKPDYVEAHFNLGVTLHAQGNLDEAAASFRRAAAIRPAFAEAHRHLGDILREQGNFNEAVASCRCAVQVDSQLAAAHNSLGLALRAQGELDEAGNCFRRAVEIQPDFVEAHSNLADALLEAGQLPQAEAAFRRALQIQPRYAPALAGLAMLLRADLPDADLTLLEGQVAAGQLSDRPRAELSFALAHVLDGRGDYVRAAACLQQANALRLKLARKPYDPAAHEAFVDGLLRAFDRDFFARVAGAGLVTRQPVFVLGLPRSGTTLVEQILASHSQVCGAGELPLARRSFEALPNALERADAPLRCVRSLDPSTLDRLAELHLAGLRAIDRQGRVRIVDKMPENYLYLGLLAAMFPRATFIHCRRDPRDVAVSCWLTDFRDVPWANAPEHIAGRFQQYGRLMEHWRTVLPAPIYEVSYEEIVADLEGVARRLVSACGLEWEPSCREFQRTVRPIRTASASQVRQPVYRRSLGRWRHYEFALAEMLARLTPAAE